LFQEICSAHSFNLNKILILVFETYEQKQLLNIKHGHVCV